MTTVTPPFTGSYAVGLQGINVSRFDLFGVSVAPKMGRNGLSTFLSSSSEIIDVSPDTRNFFDETVRSPQPITAIAALSSSNVEVISDDNYRVQQIPRFRLSRQTFGIENDIEASTPFTEMNSFDPVVYIEDPDQMAYPVVLEAANALDPFDYAGAIEPFTIRKVVGGYSTFLGTHDDPEPTGVRGAVSSGQIQANRKTKSLYAENFYSTKAQSSDYFEEVGELPEYEPLDIPEMPLHIPFESSAVSVIEPLVDDAAVEEIFRNVSNSEIRHALENAYTKIDSPNGYPGANFKSAPCGYDYENSRGIDSIAYGGLLK